MIKLISMTPPWTAKRESLLCEDCQYCRKWVCRYESCIGFGKEISNVDPDLQVCVLDYRPEFRRGLIKGEIIRRPSYQEMIHIYQLLRETGLRTVLCQTSIRDFWTISEISRILIDNC